MGIVKRQVYSKELSTALNNAFVGYNGQVTKDSETGSLHLHDGVSPGGIELGDENTLTIEEIIALLDLVYHPLGGLGTVPIWKMIQATDSTSATQLGLTYIVNKLAGIKFVTNKEDEVWSTFKIPDDYVAGTGIKFFADWTIKDATAGNVKWGLEYTVIKADNATAFVGSSLLYLTAPVAAGSAFVLHSVETLDTDLVTDVNLTPGAIVSTRIFRLGKTDSFPGDLILVKNGIKYLGV